MLRTKNKTRGVKTLGAALHFFVQVCVCVLVGPVNTDAPPTHTPILLLSNSDFFPAGHRGQAASQAEVQLSKIEDA